MLISNQNQPEEVSICINPKNINQLSAGANLNNSYYSTDGGATWNCQSTGQSLEGLWFQNANTGTIVGYNGTIIKTTDGGSSWVHQNLPGVNTWYFGVYFANLNTGFICGYNGTLLKTINGGNNWNSNLSGISNNLYMFSFLGQNIGTVVGSHGIIMRTQTCGEVLRSNGYDSPLTDIAVVPGEVPEKYGLTQNYPNPFNPSTNIEFDIAKTSAAKIVVYDMLGRALETLADQTMMPGKYSVTWNASNYPSGVYFYKLQAGDFVQTKKMMLVK